jgi:septal ring factor EnvC (AmiA/AmiB activator)
MKKYILMSMGAIVASFTFANAQSAASECGCYEAPIGKDVPKSDYVSKEYVDEKFAPIFQKLDAINSRVESLSKELANLKNDSSAGLSQKVADLEAALNSLKGSCPSACNAKLSEVEKNIAELKEKVEKRSAHMEKEVEKSMRK